MVKMLHGLEEKMVQSVEPRGEGTLSNRYIITIEGERYFAKVFRRGDNCFGSSSLEMIKNEIIVQEYISENLKGVELANILPYRGYGEISDVMVVLFEDIVSWRQGNCYTLDQKMGVQFDKISFKDKVPTSEEILSLKRSVQANNYRVYEIGDVIDIIRQIAVQVERYHNLSYKDRSGVVHMDITPKNIMIVEKLAETITNEAIVIDFGIAREKDEPIDVLFNRAKISNVNNEYYASKDGIFNLLYSPVDIMQKGEEPKLAVPSLDTYNIVNLACLMLTGRLVEYWEEETNISYPNSSGLSKVEELQLCLAKKILPRCDSIAADNLQKDKMALELARMIVSGPKINSNNRRGRYDSCGDLIKELEALDLKPNETEICKVSPPTYIPPVFENYRMPLPNEFEAGCKNEWERLMRQAFSLPDNIEISPAYSYRFGKLEELIALALQTQKNEDTLQIEKKNLAKSAPIRKALWVVGVATAAVWGAISAYLLS